MKDKKVEIKPNQTQNYTYNTNIYAEYNTIGGLIRKEVDKKSKK